MTNYQVIWRGLFSHKGGWGSACRAYVHALKKLGVDVKISKPYAEGKPKVLIYHYHPYKIDIKQARKNFDYVILNTAWETTKIPNNWFPTINEFDAVFVPSKQNLKALKDSGVTIPTFLVPHGADTDFFNPENSKMPLPNCDGRFIFVSVFDFQHRKNPEGLLKAYWEEFGPKEKVLLVIKTYWSGQKSMEGQILEIISKYKQKLGYGFKNTAPLVLITKTLKNTELKGLYTLGNAFVLPTRGEGVGLPFIEALSSGIPVIATKWGGQMDFLNEGNAFFVDYKLQSTVKSMKKAIARDFRFLFGEKNQMWAEPDISSLRNQMRKAYENPSLCNSKGKQGREDMLKMSWEKAGIALKEAIDITVCKDKKMLHNH